MKQQTGNMPGNTDQGGHEQHDVRQRVPPLPTVGPPLDGSQYQDIVEEQKYSEQRPTHEEQQPHRSSPNKKN
jgi:hypothetical protein